MTIHYWRLKSSMIFTSVFRGLFQSFTGWNALDKWAQHLQIKTLSFRPSNVQFICHLQSVFMERKTITCLYLVNCSFPAFDIVFLKPFLSIVCFSHSSVCCVFISQKIRSQSCDAENRHFKNLLSNEKLKQTDCVLFYCGFVLQSTWLHSCDI